MKHKQERLRNNNGFGYLQCSSLIKLSTLQKDLLELVKKITFWSTKSELQRKLKEYIRKRNSTPKILTRADKIANICKLPKRHYENLIDNAITVAQKKFKNSIQSKIIKEGKIILKDSEVVIRIFIIGKKDISISLKDHEHNFHNNPKTRLLNTAMN